MANEALLKFFEDLKLEDDLKLLIKERQPEDLHFEMKQKKDRSGPELDPSDKWQFSRALSGFANSDGGIMLWGMETDGEDRAKKLKPITGCADFQGRLKKSLLNAVQPMVEGVRIEVIPSNPDAGQGYVKCLIPASDKTPHRGMLADREYFKRSTEGFYRLEHFDLEDMFGRRPLPRLELKVRVVGRGSTSGGGYTTAKGLAIVSIENAGRGSARAPYLSLAPSAPYGVDRYGLDGNGHEGLTRLISGTPGKLVYTSGDVVVHPGVTHDVAAVEVYGRIDHQQSITMPAELRFMYELGAENARLKVGEMVVSVEEIATAVFPKNLYPKGPAPAA